jgi:intracellular multiplication protein IcmK
MKLSLIYLALASLMVAPVASAVGRNSSTEKTEIPDGLIQHTTDADAIDDLTDEELLKWAKEQKIKSKKILSPDERRLLLQLEQQNLDAVKDLPPPKALLDILPVSQDPVSPPIKIYITPGWDSHLSVVDANGAPWPIQYKSVGNAEFVAELIGSGGGADEESESKGKDEEKTEAPALSKALQSKLKLTTNQRVGGTNLTLMLQGSDDVINLQLLASTTQFYPTPLLQVPKIGPNTQQQYIPRGSRLMSNDKVMRAIAMGGFDLPEAYKEIQTDNQKVRAWLHGTSLYVRSPYHARVPEPQDGQAGTGGYKAYKMRYLPAITMVGDHNDQIMVRLYKNKLVENDAQTVSY